LRASAGATCGRMADSQTVRAGEALAPRNIAATRLGAPSLMACVCFLPVLLPLCATPCWKCSVGKCWLAQNSLLSRPSVAWLRGFTSVNCGTLVRLAVSPFTPVLTKLVVGSAGNCVYLLSRGTARRCCSFGACTPPCSTAVLRAAPCPYAQGVQRRLSCG